MGLPHSQVVLSANRTPLLPSTQRALRSVYQPHRQSPKGVTRVDSRQSRLVNTYAVVFTNSFGSFDEQKWHPEDSPLAGLHCNAV